ncbi:MAG TPA: bifunctional protein-disulfide isomerase/oxidoreductase DsbC [Rheinheimera sp.]|nr:bifunctional protein-disulfide isomerase/oxidoreductase DsbC [Rheinheimera sp.]
MKKFLFALAVLPLSLAAVPTTQKGIEASFADVGLQVSSIADSPVPGLFQVFTDRGLFFASKDGRYLVEGQVFDLQNKTMVNDKIMAGMRKSGVEQLKASAIEFKAPNEKHVVTVFTDTSCGYCRKLHTELKTYLDAGITVRYLAFPRGGIESETYSELESIWCADNKQEAMTRAKSGEMIAAKSCQNNVAEQYKMGASFGIQGTPAIVLPDGSIIPGYQPAQQLLATMVSKGL